MQCTGAKILMECLVEQGVDTIFGYPGGTILNVYDELYNYEGDGRIKHILTAHEQGACHAADGYARSTGRVGVCFATSGPGCTNLVTGIATAYMDSSPIVCITCNVGTSLLGKDSFQEVDITGITMPITKCNYLVRSVDELADVVREAFAIARSCGKPLLPLLFSEKTIAKYSAWTEDRGRFSKLFAWAIFLPVAPDDFLCYLAGTTEMTWRRFTAIILLGKPFAIAMYSLGLTVIWQRLVAVIA